MKYLKIFAVLYWILSLTACANLGSIRDYAKASDDLTSGTEIVTRWKNSDIELNKDNPIIDSKPGLRRSPATQQKADAAASELYKVHDALAQYFSALTLLAADDIPSTQKQGENLSNAIKDLDPKFGDPEQKAFKAIVGLLSIPLEAYRQKAVIKLIKSQDDNVDKLLSLLERSSDIIEKDLKAESNQSTAPYYTLLGDVKDPGIRFLVSERMISIQSANYQPLFTAITKYKKALSNIRDSHKKIGESVASGKDELKQTLSELKVAIEQIIAARKAVKAALN